MLNAWLDRHMMMKRITSFIVLYVFFSCFILADARARVDTEDVFHKVPGEEPVRFARLDIDTFTIPAHLGDIKYTFKGSPDKFLIHLQDAHCNQFAQHKISDIIDYLNKEYGVRMVNLEGGVGDYDLTIFTSITGEAIRMEVADYFVKKGEINGAELYAITNPGKVVLWGVEDKDMYLANLKVYRDSLAYKEEVDKYLKELTHIMNNLKRHIYTPELLKIDMAYNAYKEENMDFREYLGFLVAKAKEGGINIKQFTNLYLLARAMDLEGRIDFEKADAERDVLVDELKESLSRNEVRELVGESVDFKIRRISRRAFYDYLLKKAKGVGLNMNRFPAFSEYIVYVTTYEAVDRSRIMEELADLETEIKEPLYRNDTQRRLNALSRNLAITKNIFSIKLNKTDHKYYLANKNSFNMNSYLEFIGKEAYKYRISARPGADISKLDDYREDISRFYEYSFKRDEIFLENLRFSRVAENIKGAMLMTGGFHTESLCELLEKKNISYVSILPRFTSPRDYESPYLDLLAGQATDLERMLSSALAKTAMMQVASKLNDVLGDAVYGREGMDIFRMAAFILEKLIKERGKNIVDKIGDMKIEVKANGNVECYLGEKLLARVFIREFLFKVKDQSYPPVLDESKTVYTYRVDLNKLPVGTLIYYEIAEEHWSYTLKVEENGMVGIWLRGDRGSIVAPISEIGIFRLLREDKPSGILEDGKTAYMPYFHQTPFGEGKRRLERVGLEGFNAEPRKIAVQLPEKAAMPQKDVLEIVSREKIEAEKRKELAEDFITTVHILFLELKEKGRKRISRLRDVIHEIGAKLGMKKSEINEIIRKAENLREQDTAGERRKEIARLLSQYVRGIEPSPPVTGNIAAGLSDIEMLEWRNEAEARSDEVMENNEDVVEAVEERCEWLLLKYEDDIRRELKEYGVPETGIELIINVLKNPTGPGFFRWFEARVEGKEKYMLGNESALAVNVIRYLIDREETEVLYNDLLDEYILHEAMEKIPGLDHYAIIGLTTVIFDRGTFDDAAFSPGQTVLGRALRGFIDAEAAFRRTLDDLITRQWVRAGDKELRENLKDVLIGIKSLREADPETLEEFFDVHFDDEFIAYYSRELDRQRTSPGLTRRKIDANMQDFIRDYIQVATAVTTGRVMDLPGYIAEKGWVIEKLTASRDELAGIKGFQEFLAELEEKAFVRPAADRLWNKKGIRIMDVFKRVWSEEKKKSGARWIGRARVQGLNINRKIVPVPDVHADLEGMRDYLEGAGLIIKGEARDGTEDRWIGRDVTVVFMGDMIDRGPDPLDAMRYVRRLQKEAPEQDPPRPGYPEYKGSRVVRLLGNHELLFLASASINLKDREKAIVYQGKRMDKKLLSEKYYNLFVDDLMDDIREGKIAAAYAEGGKIFSHGVILQSLFEYVREERDRRKGAEDTFTETDFADTVNEILVEAVEGKDYSDPIFTFPGAKGKIPVGFFWGYIGYMPEYGDKLPEGLQQVVGHDPIKADLKTDLSGRVICVDTSMVRGGRKGLMFEDGKIYEITPPIGYDVIADMADMDEVELEIEPFVTGEEVKEPVEVQVALPGVKPAVPLEEPVVLPAELKRLSDEAYWRQKKAPDDYHVDLFIYTAEIPVEIGRYFDGHGMAKSFVSQEVPDLVKILQQGIDKDKGLHTMPLAVEPGAGAGFGAASPYADGGFILLGPAYGSLIKDGVKYVLVNDLYYNCIPELEKMFPNIGFIRADQALQRLARILKETPRFAAVLPAEVMEVQVDTARETIDDLRGGVMDWIVSPMNEVMVSAKASVDSEASRRFRREYGSETLMRGYIYRATLSDEVLANNLREVFEKILIEMQRSKYVEKKPRTIVFIPAGKYELAKRTLKNTLKEEGLENLEERITVIKEENIPENGVVDEVMHVVLGKALLNYERFRKRDFVTEFGQAAKMRLERFLKTLVLNPEAIDIKKDPDIINKILNGIVALRIIPIDFTEIRQWKAAQDAVLKAL